MARQIVAGPIWSNGSDCTRGSGLTRFSSRQESSTCWPVSPRAREKRSRRPRSRPPVWPGIAVDEANITQTVFLLRRALRDAGCDTAIALAPLAPNVNADKGMILAHHQRFDEAIAQFQKTLAIDPSNRHAEARALYDEIRREPDILDRQHREVLLALVLMGLGEIDEAVRRLLDDLPEGEPNAKVGYWEIRSHPGCQEFLRRSGF